MVFPNSLLCVRLGALRLSIGLKKKTAGYVGDAEGREEKHVNAF